MVDFNVSNGLPGAEEFCMLAAGRLVRVAEGFWLLVAPVDEVLKECETGYATYVLDWDWKLGLRDVTEDNSKWDYIRNKATLTFVSFCTIHVRKQDMVLVSPVDPFVDVVNGQGWGSMHFCIDYDTWLAAVHSDPSNLGLLAAVDPEHISKAPWE